MPFDFSGREDRIAELAGIAIPKGKEAKRDAIVRACIDSGHRKQFFAPTGHHLSHRGQTIFDAVEGYNLVPDNKPGKDAWTAFCRGNRPLSLIAILKIDDVLNTIAQSKNEAIRAICTVNKEVKTLHQGSVVPSIWYANPDAFQAYRVEQGNNDVELQRKRQKLSSEIFGHYETLDILEKGDGGRHAKVTRAFVNRLALTLGDGVNAIFGYHAALGPRNGDNTFALSPMRGNIIE